MASGPVTNPRSPGCRTCRLRGSLTYIPSATERALRTGELLVSQLKSHERVSLHHGDAVEENYDGCV